MALSKPKIDTSQIAQAIDTLYSAHALLEVLEKYALYEKDRGVEELSVRIFELIDEAINEADEFCCRQYAPSAEHKRRLELCKVK